MFSGAKKRKSCVRFVAVVLVVWSVVVVVTSSVFEVAVLLDAPGSGVHRCASTYGAASSSI
jgi:hypothetical protein